MANGDDDGGWNESEYMIKEPDDDDDEAIANERGNSADHESCVQANVRDRHHLVQITMVLLGTCTLLPWNFFINANNYWMYKFREPGSQINYKNKTELQATFESYLSVASTISLTVFLIIGIILSHRVRHEKRVYISILVMTILMICTTIFVKVDTDSWQIPFLAITLLIVVLVNAATAIFQGAISGVASMLPSKCINALINGQALGGVFASVANIITLSGHAATTTSALAYFLIGSFACIVALLSYITLHKSIYFNYYMKRGNTSAHRLLARTTVNTLSVAKKIFPYLISSWFVLTATLSVFPGVLVNSVSQNVGDKSVFTGLLYVPIVVFFLFNVSDFIGRTVSLWIQQPRFGNPALHLLAFLRVTLPILTLFCNRSPRHDLPILFPADYSLIILVILVGLTNGYVLNLTMMYAPMAVENHEQELVGNMMAASAGSGVMTGTLIGLLLVHIV